MIGRRAKAILMTSVHQCLRAVWFVTRPTSLGVHALVATESGRVVLVKHSYKPRWHLPGGARKRGEPPEQAIVRELAEEIGLTAYTRLERIRDYDHRPDFRRGRLTFFVVTGARYHPVESLEIEEIGAFEADHLPPDCTAATRRRIGEWARGEGFGDAW